MRRELAWSDESEAHIAKHNVTPSDSTLIYGRTPTLVDTMSSKTRLEALAEHYDSTDAAAELKEATAADGPDPPPSPTG